MATIRYVLKFDVMLLFTGGWPASIRQVFSETLIPEMYQKVYLKVKDDVSSASHISITTDVWSFVA